jgi:hypothetical protein
MLDTDVLIVFVGLLTTGFVAGFASAILFFGIAL